MSSCIYRANFLSTLILQTSVNMVCLIIIIYMTLKCLQNLISSSAKINIGNITMIAALVLGVQIGDDQNGKKNQVSLSDST